MADQLYKVLNTSDVPISSGPHEGLCFKFMTKNGIPIAGRREELLRVWDESQLRLPVEGELLHPWGTANEGTVISGAGC